MAKESLWGLRRKKKRPATVPAHRDDCSKARNSDLQRTLNRHLLCDASQQQMHSVSIYLQLLHYLEQELKHPESKQSSFPVHNSH
jgi:hypothetical protein